MGGYYGAAVRPAKVTIIRRATLRSRLIMVESQTTQALADVKLAASGLEQLLSGSRKREADAAELRSCLEQQSHAVAQSRQLQAAELQKLHAQLNELREAGGGRVDDSSLQTELTAAAQVAAQAAAQAKVQAKVQAQVQAQMEERMAALEAALQGSREAEGRREPQLSAQLSTQLSAAHARIEELARPRS